MFCDENELSVLEGYQNPFNRSVVEKCLQEIAKRVLVQSKDDG